MEQLSQLTIIIEKRGDQFIGYIVEIRGANTQGTTVDEVLENLKEVLHLIIERG